MSASALVALALFGACFVAPAGATYPGRNGRIAVVGPTFPGPIRVWTIRPDGSQPRLLRSVHDFPAWSPDGGRLLFSGPCRAFGGCGNSGEDGPNELDTVDAGGRHLTRIRFRTPGRWGYGPVNATWSPHATRLLFIRGVPEEGGDLTVFASTANGRRQRRLLRTGQELRPIEARYSPDGRQIAIASFRGLYVMNSNGSDLHPLLACSLGYACAADSVDWSPDGHTLAFSSFVPASGQEEVQLIPSGGGVARVVRPGTRPFWSPDGRQLASLSAVGSPNSSLQVSMTDGSGLRTIRQRVSYAAWQPLSR